MKDFKPEKKLGFWGRITASLKAVFTKEMIIEQLKGKVVKLAIKKILGSGAVGGFKVWIVKYIVTELYEEIAEPIIRLALNHVGYLYHKHEGKVIIKRIKQASEDNNETDYNDAVDDLFDR